MAGVGDEQPLAVEGGIQAAEHLVEGVGEFAQFVVRPTEVDALVQVVGRQLLRRLGEPRDGTQGLLGEQVSADRADHHDDGEEDQP